MNQEFMIYIATRMLWTMAKVAGPILISSLLVGLIIAIFQSATQIQEMMDLGCEDYVLKPIDREDLLAKIHKYLIKSFICLNISTDSE